MRCFRLITLSVSPGFRVVQSLKFPYDSNGMWEESWSGSSDTKPRGESPLPPFSAAPRAIMMTNKV